MNTGTSIYPLSPDGDKHVISSCNITTRSNKQVMRIKQVITKDELSGNNNNNIIINFINVS